MNAINWLRNNEPDLSNVDDSTVQAFSNLTGMAMPDNLTPKNKRAFMQGALDWLRNNDPDLNENIDDQNGDPNVEEKDPEFSNEGVSKRIRKTIVDDVNELNSSVKKLDRVSRGNVSIN